MNPKNENLVGAKKPYYPELPKAEVAGYFVFCFGCVLYSVSLVYGVSKENEKQYLNSGYLEPGSHFFNGKLKDTSDPQWRTMTMYMWEIYIVGFSGHFMVARFAERYWPKRRYHILSLYGAAFTLHFFGLNGILFLLGHFFIQYAVACLTVNVWACWISGFLLCLSLVDSFSSEYSYFNFTFALLVRPFQTDDDKSNFLVYVTAMCNLRNIAFSLEYVWARKLKHNRMVSTETKPGAVQCVNATSGIRKRKTKPCDSGPRPTVPPSNASQPLLDHEFTPLDLLVFQFYYPLMFGGPVMSYKRFVLETTKRPLIWTKMDVMKFLLGNARFGFWIVFIEFTLHFFYLPSLSFDEKVVQRTNSFFPAFGLGVVQVGFFYMKHVICYGLPSHIASSDNFNAPKGPHCVYSKHRLTDIWKTFDQGLHEWLVRYIYLPLGGSKVKFYRRPLNSFLPFIFTAIWHGTDYQYIHWAVLSWAGVFVEDIAFKMYKTKYVQTFEQKYLSMAWSRRIRAALSSVMFGAALTIDVYFQSGMEVGNAYWNKFYHETAFITFLFHLTYYTCTQCCMELHRWGITSE